MPYGSCLASVVMSETHLRLVTPSSMETVVLVLNHGHARHLIDRIKRLISQQERYTCAFVHCNTVLTFVHDSFRHTTESIFLKSVTNVSCFLRRKQTIYFRKHQTTAQKLEWRLKIVVH